MRDAKDKLESLAELEHKQWVSWAKSLMKEEKLSPARVKRWKECLCSYDKLTEEMKDFDREWANKAVKIMKAKVASYVAVAAAVSESNTVEGFSQLLDLRENRLNPETMTAFEMDEFETALTSAMMNTTELKLWDDDFSTAVEEIMSAFQQGSLTDSIERLDGDLKMIQDVFVSQGIEDRAQNPSSYISKIKEYEENNSEFLSMIPDWLEAKMVELQWKIVELNTEAYFEDVNGSQTIAASDLHSLFKAAEKLRGKTASSITAAYITNLNDKTKKKLKDEFDRVMLQFKIAMDTSAENEDGSMSATLSDDLYGLRNEMSSLGKTLVMIAGQMDKAADKVKKESEKKVVSIKKRNAPQKSEGRGMDNWKIPASYTVLVDGEEVAVIRGSKSGFGDSTSWDITSKDGTFPTPSKKTLKDAKDWAMKHFSK